MEVSRGKDSRPRFQLHPVYKVHYLPAGRLDSAQLLMLKDPLLLEVNQRNETSVEMQKVSRGETDANIKHRAAGTEVSPRLQRRRPMVARLQLDLLHHVSVNITATITHKRNIQLLFIFLLYYKKSPSNIL